MKIKVKTIVVSGLRFIYQLTLAYLISAFFLILMIILTEEIFLKILTKEILFSNQTYFLTPIILVYILLQDFDNKKGLWKK
jgi:hypothetical protein